MSWLPSGSGDTLSGAVVGTYATVELPEIKLFVTGHRG